MNLVKHRIQDESALRTVLEIQSTALVSQVIDELHDTYKTYRIQRRWFFFGILAPFGFGVLGALLSEMSDIAEVTGLLIIMPVVIGYFYCLFRYVVPAGLGILKFSRRVDGLLFAPAATVAGLENATVSQVEVPTGPMSRGSSRSSIRLFIELLKQQQSFDQQITEPVITRLRSSELITESFNVTTVETVCSGTVQGNVIVVAELDVKHESGSGKNRTVHEIFHGYFVEYTLKKSLLGKTFVTTEQDKSGFGNLSFFNATSPQETFLEWNDFENMLHVATTNEVEARYILTPDFMADLYDWWKGQSGNIRISFIGDRMYVLYPDKKIRVGDTIKDLDEVALLEHLFTIARPLLHIVHLTEDVRL